MTDKQIDARPFYKKKRWIALALIVLLFVIAGITNSGVGPPGTSDLRAMKPVG